MLRTLVAATLLAASTSLLAQAPAPADKPAGKPHYARHDCSKAADPKACEERRAKVREAAKKAHAACDAKAGDERRDCMRKELCAQSKDPAQCEARAKERAEKRKQRLEQRKQPQDQKK
jgi:Spy/CpxP family protein refolding chaperone